MRNRRRQLALGGGAPAAFSPSSLSAVSAWLRVANATSGVNGISSVPDVLNTNPAVQSVDARKPVIENSVNGLPCMRFATNDVLSWPITAQSSAPSYAGWGMWVKCDAGTILQSAIRVRTGTGAASANKISVALFAGRLWQSAYYIPSPTNGTRTDTIAADTGWHFVTVEFDPDGLTSDTQRTLTVDNVLTGTVSGATVGTLTAGVTGNILIGNNVNDVASTGALNGLIGPNIYAFGAKMPGATQGLLTTAARTALMNFEAPT